MASVFTRWCGVWSALLGLLMGSGLAEQRVWADVGEVRFSRDVLPILADRCFHCHGPDESHREADLRLDLHETATAEREGQFIIKPGDPDASELLKRITTSDEYERMPPADAHRKPLTEREIAVLRKWIAEGAEWGRHWAFELPVKPSVPELAAHPIDAFVRQGLQEAGLSPAPPAAPHTRLRRLSFDLTGLPPTPSELQAFQEAGATPAAYRAAVERLLTSPQHGERMAMWWLDLARYSDTDGYQQDATRTNWPWRDWVIRAFNDNMPFDQFTLEQFAGDLLPEATPEQILATCFHRNHMTNGEGGRDPEESRIDYVIDRVNTTGTVWLGLTLGCCQCHSHKFDPISQRDYYQLFAFFNSIDEDGRAGANAKPYLKYRSPFTTEVVEQAEQLAKQRGQRETAVRQQAEQEFPRWLTERREELQNGFQPWRLLQASRLESVAGTVLTQEANGAIQTSGPHPRQEDYRIHFRPTHARLTGFRLEVQPHPTHTNGGLSRGKQGDFILTNVKLQVRQQGKSQLRDIELATAVADYEPDVKGKNYGKVIDTLDDDPRNGWTMDGEGLTEPHRAIFSLAEPLFLQEDEELILVLYHRSTLGEANIGRFRVETTDQPGAVLKSLDPLPLEALAEHLQSTGVEVTAAEENNTDGSTNPAEEQKAPLAPELQKRLLAQFLADHDVYQTVKREWDDATRQLATFRKAAGDLNVMILQQRNEPRETHILQRGVWDKKGERVTANFPAAILPGDNDNPVDENADDNESENAADSVPTRLDLAHWLVSPENPLTARVVVNHLWQLCFGAGLVRTPEDFGLQGEFPTHPDLLDWLAVELVEHDWDLRHILRLIVTSETYQQESRITPELREQDPDNRWLARGARFRLPSWMIRDAALHSSGLLSPTVGGPPVYPYQPEGVWEAMFMGRFRYEPSQGEAQFRRTIYAFWRRSAAPTFLFDSAQRRVCEVNVSRTNTPLQALTLMNDLSLREAARRIARDAIESTGKSTGKSTEQEAAEASALPSKVVQTRRLTGMFAQVLGRAPDATELNRLQQSLTKAHHFYQQHPAMAEQLLAFGQPEESPASADPEWAAYYLVASLILNLDEAITHE